MSLDEVYDMLSKTSGHSRATLLADPKKATELMREFTHKLSAMNPQELDVIASPKKVPAR